MTATRLQALVVGAGYFGCRLALELKRLGLSSVVLADREPAIMARASWGNQARVHSGYHYPRSLTTGMASRQSFARFVDEHRYAIDLHIDKYYAIAHGSLVNPNQFERFCDRIGAPLRPVSPRVAGLFDRDRIDAVYEVEEFAFDAGMIADVLTRELQEAGVDVRLESLVRTVRLGEQPLFEVAGELVQADLVLNCAYAGLDELGIPIRTQLRKELAEITLVQVPDALSRLGVTVMDGPYFSCMPFPSLGVHSLSHVRFTPVTAWMSGEAAGSPPPTGLGRSTNGPAMLRDAARFIPVMDEAQIVGSFYEVKTVLMATERNDGRPILFERCEQAPSVVSVLGGKIDNVYDILASLEDLMAEGI